MKRTAFDEKRDQRTAVDVDSNRRLMCSAHGCPLPWSINAGQALCTLHSRYEPHDWPRATEWIQQREQDAVFEAQTRRPAPPAKPLSADEKRAIGQKLRRAFRQVANKDWAKALEAREKAGDNLTEAQRTMWRQALGRSLALHGDEVLL